MQTVCYNQQQLDTVLADVYDKFGQYGSLSINYDRPYKPHTLRQLGYFFGCIVSAIKDYYRDLGDDMDDLAIRENLYYSASLLDPTLRRRIKQFNGVEREVPLRLSEMDIEQASKFIDGCIRLIDNAECFRGLTLHPAIRYTWLQHIKQVDLWALKDVVLPRKDEEYLEHTRKQACLVCGVMGQSQVHHLKQAGLTGTAYKADDWCCIPLCPKCHLGLTHGQGQQELEKALWWICKYTSLTDFAKMRYLRWRNHI